MNPALIGNYISEKRRSMGWTQRQLARQLSVTHQAVSRWEQGLALPDIETLVAMARLFGITVDRLLNPEVKGTAQPSNAPLYADIEYEPEEGKEAEEAPEPDEPGPDAEAVKAAENEEADGAGEPDEADYQAEHGPYRANMASKNKYWASHRHRLPFRIPMPNINIPEIRIPEIRIPGFEFNGAFNKSHRERTVSSETQERRAGYDGETTHRDAYDEGLDSAARLKNEDDDVFGRLENLAPFVSREVFSSKFMSILERVETIEPDSLCDLAPYLNRETLYAALDKIDIKNMIDTGFIQEIAPFIRGSKLAELISQIKDKRWLIDHFEELIPFLPRETADRIFMDLF